MLKFLDKTRNEFLSDKLPSKLRSIVCDIEYYVNSNSEYKTLIVTSVFRTKEKQQQICKDLGKKYYASVHEYWRGVDIFIKDAPRSYHKKVADTINEVYPYGSGRFKTVVLHGSNIPGLGFHLHLQVNDQTV